MDEERFTPIHGSFPDKNSVFCKDCKFRDRTTVKLGQKEYTVGTTRDTCQKYNGNEAYKPNDILFKNAPCDYYEKDLDGERYCPLLRYH